MYRRVGKLNIMNMNEFKNNIDSEKKLLYNPIILPFIKNITEIIIEYFDTTTFQAIISHPDLYSEYLHFLRKYLKNQIFLFKENTNVLNNLRKLQTGESFEIFQHLREASDNFLEFLNYFIICYDLRKQMNDFRISYQHWYHLYDYGLQALNESIHEIIIKLKHLKQMNIININNDKLNPNKFLFFTNTDKNNFITNTIRILLILFSTALLHVAPFFAESMGQNIFHSILLPIHHYFYHHEMELNFDFDQLIVLIHLFQDSLVKLIFIINSCVKEKKSFETQPTEIWIDNSFIMSHLGHLELILKEYHSLHDSIYKFSIIKVKNNKTKCVLM